MLEIHIIQIILQKKLLSKYFCLQIVLRFTSLAFHLDSIYGKKKQICK